MEYHPKVRIPSLLLNSDKIQVPGTHHKLSRCEGQAAKRGNRAPATSRILAADGAARAAGGPPVLARRALRADAAVGPDDHAAARFHVAERVEELVAQRPLAPRDAGRRRRRARAAAPRGRLIARSAPPARRARRTAAARRSALSARARRRATSRSRRRRARRGRRRDRRPRRAAPQRRGARGRRRRREQSRFGVGDRGGGADVDVIDWFGRGGGGSAPRSTRRRRRRRRAARLAAARRATTARSRRIARAARRGQARAAVAVSRLPRRRVPDLLALGDRVREPVPRVVHLLPERARRRARAHAVLEHARVLSRRGRRRRARAAARVRAPAQPDDRAAALAQEQVRRDCVPGQRELAR